MKKSKIQNLKSKIIKHLASHNLTLAIAESCTGGMLSSWLTEQSGVSNVFKGGVVCYANDVKQRILGVPKQTLQKHGAVSAETATALARGVRKALKADVAIAITGIAGPTGAVSGKPVGTVFIATCEGQKVTARRYQFTGGRKAVREKACVAALQQILDFTF